MPSDKIPSPPLSTFNRTFRTLRSRNYRLFFGGQCISLIGTWMQQIAVSWMVYRLTNSVFLLGIVSFATQIPTFVFSPFAGVLTDRWDRYRILLVTQSLSMLQALLLAIFILSHTVTIWHIVVISLFLGCVNALDLPTRQSFVMVMIENKEDLGNAIALNSAMFNASRLAGPAIAGILISMVGEGWCILLNAISYLAVIAALMCMKISIVRPEKKNTNIVQELKEGFVYAYGFTPIRAILLLLALTSMMGVPYVVLLPPFAKDILHGGSQTLGFLMSAAGAGALVGVVFLASKRSVLGLGKILGLSSGLFGASLIGFSFSRIIWISLAFMFTTGMGLMVMIAAGNTLLQTIVDDDKRGRIMSFFGVAVIGVVPFGSLVAGSLAGMIGVPDTLLIGGGFCIIGSLFFIRALPRLRDTIRPIYLRKSIIHRS
ncbi:MAG: Enterobactin exporter EntS [Syntrophus sp. SKADARSKE-3]|nr:Enterobactin exporter EntS [Syntrophus sp. SKADARSKE-3]